MSDPRIYKDLIHLLEDEIKELQEGWQVSIDTIKQLEEDLKVSDETVSYLKAALEMFKINETDDLNSIGVDDE